ncbi:MAG: DUF3011 domain-containing protein [Pyrinomonadaceae bacterium]
MKFRKLCVLFVLIATTSVMAGPRGGVTTPLLMESTFQTGTITCESYGGSYRYCRIDTQNQVQLTRQMSDSPCRYDYSWGYDYRGIWVDRGCRAEFKYGRSSSNSGAVVAGGVLGAILIGAAVAGSRRKVRAGDNESQKWDFYNQGYRFGQQDWNRGRDANVTRWRAYYENNSAYESDFDEGYDDGYNNRQNKYH